MRLFLVVPREGHVDRIEAKIRDRFTNYYMELPQRGSKMWMVAADKYKTTYEISLVLNINANVDVTQRSDGVVFSIDEYYGHDLTEIWQKMDVWRTL